jgi:hypothetical protein
LRGETPGFPLAGKRSLAIAERLDGLKDVLTEQFMPDGAITALAIGALLRLAWMDMPKADPLRLSSFQQRAADVFHAVVHTNGAWSAALFDDPVQAADDPLGRQRKVDLDAPPLVFEVNGENSTHGAPSRPGLPPLKSRSYLWSEIVGMLFLAL